MYFTLSNGLIQGAIIPRVSIYYAAIRRMLRKFVVRLGSVCTILGTTFAIFRENRSVKFSLLDPAPGTDLLLSRYITTPFLCFSSLLVNPKLHYFYNEKKKRRLQNDAHVLPAIFRHFFSTCGG